MSRLSESPLWSKVENRKQSSSPQPKVLVLFANLEVLLGGLLHSIVEVKGVRLVLLIPLRWHVAHDEHAAKARVSQSDRMLTDRSEPPMAS